MKVLIVTIKSRIFHLASFCEELKKTGIDCRIIDDDEFLDKSNHIFSSYKKNNKFKKKLDEYNPNFVLLDRHSKLGLTVMEKNIPLLVTVRGHIWKEEEWAKETLYKNWIGKISLKRKREIIMRCLDGAEIILVLSDYLADIIQERLPDKKISKLSISSRNSEYWKSEEKMELNHPCVGFLQGANIWGKTKGLIDIESVIKRMPDVMFYWAGDGIYSQRVLERFNKYKNFKWLGNIQYPDSVKKFLSGIDVFALPTGMDTLGQSIIEASLMEKPVIATNVGGIPEVIDDGSTGYLIEKNNVDLWIDKIRFLIDNKDEREELGKNGRNSMIKKFNWEKTAKRFLEILNEK